MQTKQKIRMAIDTAMTILSVVLMGGTLGFARTAHLVSSHWYYLFMCAHLGMHIGMIFNRIKAKRTGQTESAEMSGGWRSETSHDTPSHRKSPARKIILCVLLALVCGYGVSAFIARGIANYLFLRQQFFFLDLERGYLLFAVDYIAILVLFSAASHYLGKVLLAIGKKRDVR